MPFVQRDEAGKVTGIFANPQPGYAEEFLDPESPEIENYDVLRKWMEVRDTRTRLLKLSDWTQIPDAPLSQGKREEWAEYRQALRDLTDSFENPDDVVFPATPSA